MDPQLVRCRCAVDGISKTAHAFSCMQHHKHADERAVHTIRQTQTNYNWLGASLYNKGGGGRGGGLANCAGGPYQSTSLRLSYRQQQPDHCHAPPGSSCVLEGSRQRMQRPCEGAICQHLPCSTLGGKEQDRLTRSVVAKHAKSNRSH